jgi:diguanylate cyclase (GGDEF)-like protein
VTLTANHPGIGASLDLKDSSLLLLREDVGESYDAVVRSAAAAVGAESCDLALYDSETGQLIARRPRYAAPPGAIPQYRFAPTPASAHVIDSGEPYVSNDPGSDRLYSPSVRDAGVRSVLTVPVRRGNRILGLLYALNKPGGFTPDDVQTLLALAGAVAVTLENIRLYAEERERRVLNESLREVSRVLVSTPAEDAALAAVLDQMWRVVRYQAAAAVLVEGPRLRVAAARGGEVDVEIPLDSAQDLRAALERRQLAVLSDAAARFTDLGFRGVRGKALVAPLLAKGEVLGALIVGFESDRAPGLGDGHLVTAFADHAALFLEAGAILRRERQARARASALARITRLAATRHDPESLLQSVAPELLALSGADRVILYLRHVRNAVLIPVADAGTIVGEEERARDLRLDMSVDPLLRLTQERKPLLFHVDGNPPPSSITPFSDTTCMAVIPLVSREEILGAALLASVKRQVVWDAALIGFLDDIVQQIALGVENARLFSQLSQMASTDELTQLANRRRFSETLRLEMARARRQTTPLSLVMADVDHLKKINDGFGHPAGDAAIRHVADSFRRGRRETDLAARLGGEEFALLLPGTDLAGAVKAAERIRQELSDSSVAPAGTVTVSIGVATWPDDAGSETDLVQAADERLYSAKTGGRNRVCSTGTNKADPTLPLDVPSRLRH